MFSQRSSDTRELLCLRGGCRAWVRLSCDLQAFVEDEDRAPEQARIVNVSHGGIGLMFPEPIPLGTILRIELAPPKDEGPHVFVARVQQPGMEKQDGWLVGCEFVQPLSNKRIQELLRYRISGRRGRQ